MHDKNSSDILASVTRPAFVAQQCRGSWPCDRGCSSSPSTRPPLQNIVASAELLSMKDNRPDSVAAIRRIRYAVTVLQGQLRDLHHRAW